MQGSRRYYEGQARKLRVPANVGKRDMTEEQSGRFAAMIWGIMIGMPLGYALYFLQHQ